MIKKNKRPPAPEPVSHFSERTAAIWREPAAAKASPSHRGITAGPHMFQGFINAHSWEQVSLPRGRSSADATGRDRPHARQ